MKDWIWEYKMKSSKKQQSAAWRTIWNECLEQGMDIEKYDPEFGNCGTSNVINFIRSLVKENQKIRKQPERIHENLKQ